MTAAGSPRWVGSLRNAVTSFGLPERWATAVAMRVDTQAEAQAAYRLLALLDKAGALSLLLIVLDRGMTLGQVESLLRAAGARDDQPLHGDALAAVRHRLLHPHETMPPRRSSYLERRYG